MYKYSNGNSEITLYNDGTRIIEFENDLNLEYPLNLDIRVSTSCSFANNVCKDFCHESAVVNGKDADYNKLKEVLSDLPKGIELAIGCNSFTTNLFNFLVWCKEKEYVCNLTINQGHIKRDYLNIISAINDGIVKGLGVSYRSSLKWDVPQFILDYPNTVFHIIVGIDDVNDVKKLAEKGVKKILCLGEKDFGYNYSKVDLDSKKHQEWYWWIGELFSKFKVVSFDNLGLEQLNVKRFLSNAQWDTFYQHEYSFYIDAVSETFSPSSRSINKTSWNIPIKQYFRQLQK